MPHPDPAQEQAEKAAAEAAAIGGRTSSDPDPVDQEKPDQSQRPLAEAGQGESEGFEESERELVEHASHSDQHAARQVLEDMPLAPTGDDGPVADPAEADRERSSERADDDG
jgi:hypothetical protein